MKPVNPTWEGMRMSKIVILTGGTSGIGKATAALLRQKDIRFFVTKDGGPAGGFPEKAEAARETGIELVLLCRPEESGMDFGMVYQKCITLIQKSDAI